MRHMMYTFLASHRTVCETFTSGNSKLQLLAQNRRAPNDSPCMSCVMYLHEINISPSSTDACMISTGALPPGAGPTESNSITLFVWKEAYLFVL